MNKLILLLTLINFSHDVLARDKEKIIICTIQKTAYVNMPSILEDKVQKLLQVKQPFFQLETKEGNEIYTLKIREQISQDFTFNLSYRETKNNLSWEINDQIKRFHGKTEILHSNQCNFVLRFSYPNSQQVYFFSLDAKDNGFLTITNTRWDDPFANNQSIYFGECKRKQ